VTSFTFTAQDLISAPVEVRRWLVGRIEADLLAAGPAAPIAPPVPAPALDACSPEEAFSIFELLKGDFAATHVFLELARGETAGIPASPLHAINIGAIVRNTRLDDQRLISCLDTINRAFQEVRGNPQAMLFGSDHANHVYIHETTYRSVQSLWQELARLHVPAEVRATEPAGRPPAMFSTHQAGPSEDIATHQQH